MAMKRPVTAVEWTALAAVTFPGRIVSQDGARGTVVRVSVKWDDTKKPVDYDPDSLKKMFKSEKELQWLPWQ